MFASQQIVLGTMPLEQHDRHAQAAVTPSALGGLLRLVFVDDASYTLALQHSSRKKISAQSNRQVRPDKV